MKRLRKTMTWLLLSLLGILGMAGTLSAGSEATCIFLLIEPGSRAGGMGHSHVSMVDGALSAWWNPGALAFNEKSDLALMHSNWFGDVVDDMYYEYLSYVQKFEGIGNLGFNLTYMTYGEQQAMDAQGNELTAFDSYELAAGISYGAPITSSIGLGVNFKIVYSGLVPSDLPGMDGEGAGYTFVMDVGMQKRDLFIPRLNFGLNLQNLGPDIKYKNSNNAQPMPLNWRMGFSYRLLDSPLNVLTLSGDMNKMLVDPDEPLWKRWFTSLYDDDFSEELEQTIFNFGAEYKYYDLISLRVGYVYDKAGQIKGYSFGGGINYEFSKGKNLSFDFALQPAGELTDNNKTFSVGLTF